MKRPELLIENGLLAGRRFAVSEKGLRLGRSSSNDVHIPDEELSRNHCFFEVWGEEGIRVTDLASANGTMVNGQLIGGDAVDLHTGDIIEVGGVVIRVVDDSAETIKKENGCAAKSVDLGFGGRSTAAVAAPAAPVRRRSPLANILWALVVLVFLGGTAVVLMDMNAAKPVAQEIAESEQPESLRELSYEKIDADSEKVFRYSMTLVGGSTLTVSLDDVPDEDRHLNKSIHLSETAKARLEEILSDPDLRTLDREYAGPETEPPVLRSRDLKVVWTRHSKRVFCINTVEPEVFVRIREKLEAFSKNELGIWAMGHSRSQLIELAEASAENAEVKWEDREVEYGNCYAAVRAWKEAIFYLETVNPKPDVFDEYQKSLKTAEEELERRYRDHRFAADRAINLADWLAAKEELQVLLAMVPDRDDDRYREASAKLVDVEKRLNAKK